ncbi:MAG: hypothetical protein JRJ12_01150 [Deltaproteobacteria bacterium]|nr:hypothetical protein [Deltaproteobacteria bacterium]MBW2072420.1 hypothetical protein [Deltaproteobacteria bacterium]
MKSVRAKAALLSFCLLILFGCYVRTELRSSQQKIPPVITEGILVVAADPSNKLRGDQRLSLEKKAVAALQSEGIDCVGLSDVSNFAASADIKENLKQRGYQALLQIAVSFMGARDEIILNPATPSVDSIDNNRDSLFFKPGSIEQSNYPGSMSTFKEVEVTASLLDLSNGARVWQAQANSRPGLVGRSFLYHSFNRSLNYEDLLQRCIEKIAASLRHAWQQTGS